MTAGYVKLHRQIAENPIWTRDRFSYGQAFVDMILQAAWKDTKFLKGSQWVTVKRGQLLTTQVWLAQRWLWDRKTVKKFLTTLKADTVLDIAAVRAADSGYTLITIINYNKFQDEPQEGMDSGLPSDMDSGLPSARTAHGQRTVNVKESKKNIEEGKKKIAQRSRFVPSDFVLTEELRLWARQKVPDINIDAEIEKFRDHEFPRAYSDWPAVCRNWLRGAQERKQSGYNGNGGARNGTDGGEERKLRRGQIAYDPILQAKMEEEDKRWREAQIIEKT